MIYISLVSEDCYFILSSYWHRSIWKLNMPSIAMYLLIIFTLLLLLNFSGFNIIYEKALVILSFSKFQLINRIEFSFFKSFQFEIVGIIMFGKFSVHSRKHNTERYSYSIYSLFFISESPYFILCQHTFQGKQKIMELCASKTLSS